MVRPTIPLLAAFLLLALQFPGLTRAMAPPDCLPGEDLIDTDFDQVSNCLEEHLGLSPLAADTDLDGVADHLDLLPNVNQNPILTVSLADITEVTETCDVSNNKYFDPYIGNAFARLPLASGTQTGVFPNTGYSLKTHPHDSRTDSFSAQTVKLTGTQDFGLWHSNYFGLPGVDLNLGFLDHDSTNADDKIDAGANTPIAIPAYDGPDGQPITQTLMGSDGTCAACVSTSVASPIRYEDAVQVSLAPAPPAIGLPAMVTYQQLQNAIGSGVGVPPPKAGNCAASAAGNAASGAGSTGLVGGDIIGMADLGLLPTHPVPETDPCPGVEHKWLYGSVGNYQNSISSADYFHGSNMVARLQAYGTNGFWFDRSSNFYDDQSPMRQDAVALAPLDLLDPATCTLPDHVTVQVTLDPGLCCDGVSRTFEVVPADLPDDNVYAVTTQDTLFTTWGDGYDIGLL